MIEYMFENNALYSASVFVCKRMGENGYSDILMPEFPPFNPPPILYYTDQYDGFFNFIVNETGRAKTTYLPYFVVDFIQSCLSSLGRFDVNDNVRELRRLQEFVYDILFIFWLCCNYRMKLAWFIIINPYQFPFDVLRTLTDWYLNVATGCIPFLLGIDYSPTIMFTALGWVLDRVRYLAVVPPFRYSEGELFDYEGALAITDNPALVKALKSAPTDGSFRIFRKLPSVWIEKPIPDNLREYWAIRRPEIFDYLMEHYSHLGIQFIPDKIAKLKPISQAINLPDYFDNLSINLISLKDSLLSVDVSHFHF